MHYAKGSPSQRNSITLIAEQNSDIVQPSSLHALILPWWRCCSCLYHFKKPCTLAFYDEKQVWTSLKEVSFSRNLLSSLNTSVKEHQSLWGHRQFARITLLLIWNLSVYGTFPRCGPIQFSENSFTFGGSLTSYISALVWHHRTIEGKKWLNSH